MAFKSFTTSEGLTVETELTGAIVRISTPLKARVFTVNVSHNGQGKARFSNGYGQLSIKVRIAIREWLRHNGFNSYTFERGSPDNEQTSSKAP